MVRSLRILGACVAFIISSSSALSLSTPPAISIDAMMTTQSGSSSSINRDTFVMGPIVQKASMKTSSPAFLERSVAQRKETSEPTKKKNGVGRVGWEVRIFNDGMNTREHVARSLVQITGLSEVAAYQAMMQAHQNGKSTVGTWVYERAEMYRDTLEQNGIICDMVPLEEER